MHAYAFGRLALCAGLVGATFLQDAGINYNTRSRLACRRARDFLEKTPPGCPLPISSPPEG